MSIIEIKKLKKVYDPFSAYPKTAIENLNLTVEKGDFICVMGASGSGKTTLVNILSTNDDATNGEVLLDGENIALMSEKQKAIIRKTKIGFIFQNYNLIESLTIKDNILFSLRLNHVDIKTQQTALDDIIKVLAIEDIINKYPHECSGGQQQRCAIARALINKPQIVFADEPTGNLDSLNSRELMELFVKINQENNTTIVMVTHDSLVASYSMKVYYMMDGNVNQSINRQNKTQEEYYREIINMTSNINLTAG